VDEGEGGLLLSRVAVCLLEILYSVLEVARCRRSRQVVVGHKWEGGEYDEGSGACYFPWMSLVVGVLSVLLIGYMSHCYYVAAAAAVDADADAADAADAAENSVAWCHMTQVCKVEHVHHTVPSHPGNFGDSHQNPLRWRRNAAHCVQHVYFRE